MLPPSTETLGKIFSSTQQEARRLNQEFVGIEHLALALLDDDSSEAVRLLQQMNISTGYVRNTLAHALPQGSEPPIVTGDLPMSPKVQRLITTAICASQAAGQEKLSSRFLLSTMLSEASGVVCDSFRRNGADINELSRGLRERQVTPEA
jgi:ATP-dependent Clp protease ATP-binding subunit ClpC